MMEGANRGSEGGGRTFGRFRDRSFRTSKRSNPLPRSLLQPSTTSTHARLSLSLKLERVSSCCRAASERSDELFEALTLDPDGEDAGASRSAVRLSPLVGTARLDPCGDRLEVDDCDG